MRIIPESHIHMLIDPAWVAALPESPGFSIQVHETDQVGYDHCVESEGHETYWLQRAGRPGLSRMVTGVAPVRTTSIVTVEVPHDGQIVLATAYYGRVAADKEPFEADWSAAQCDEWVRNNPESFWATHGLIEE
jgi:hypothetical protein